VLKGGGISFLAGERICGGSGVVKPPPPVHAPRSPTPSDLPNTVLKPPRLDRGEIPVLKPTVQIKRSVHRKSGVRFFGAFVAEAVMDFRPAPYPIGGSIRALRDPLVSLR